jgi:signal peptidase I
VRGFGFGLRGTTAAVVRGVGAGRVNSVTRLFPPSPLPHSMWPAVKAVLDSSVVRAVRWLPVLVVVNTELWHVVEGGGMEPTAVDRDIVLVNRFTQGQRGDVVLLRCVLCVSVCGLCVCGANCVSVWALKRSYRVLFVTVSLRVPIELLRSSDPADPDRTLMRRIVGIPGDWVQMRTNPTAKVFLKPGQLWIENDHAGTACRDSCDFGPVPMGLVLGRASAVIWPPHHGKLIARAYRQDRLFFPHSFELPR